MVCVSCGSLGSVLWGFVLFLWVLSWFHWGVILCPWGSCSVCVLGPGSVDIFKFLFRKKGWVKLCIMLATQSIEARAQRERCRQACTIGSLIMRIQSQGKEKKTGGAVGLFKYQEGPLGTSSKRANGNVAE